MLSKMQSEILNFIVKSIHDDDVVPTFREIAEATGFSISSCRNSCLELEALGYLRRREHKYRSIRVVKRPDEAEAA
jgi:SOS-response transcriptional repressor LexA